VDNTKAGSGKTGCSSAGSALKILLIDGDPIRREILKAGLLDAGFVNVVRIETTNGLLDQVYRIDPDVILIDLENPSRDVLEQMFQVSRIVRRPIAMFVDQSDQNTTEAAAARRAGAGEGCLGGTQGDRSRQGHTHASQRTVRGAGVRRSPQDRHE
jgi:response regulator NasT